MKELIENIAKSLADAPSQVRVDEIEGTNSVVLELHVAPEDMGRIIGRKGRVANAMRTLLRVLAAKQGKRVTLEIVESPVAEAAAEEVVAEEVASLEEEVSVEEAAPTEAEVAEEVTIADEEVPLEEEAPVEEAAPTEVEVAEEVPIVEEEVPSEEELIEAPFEEEVGETTGEEAD